MYKQRYPEWRSPPGHYLKIGFGDYFIDAKGVKREYWYDGEAYRKYWKNGFSDEELARQLESCTSLKIVKETLGERLEEANLMITLAASKAEHEHPAQAEYK